MADTKISALTESLVPSFDDVLPVVVGASTMKVKRRNLGAHERAISEYASFASALSTISTTPTTLVITSDITVSTATVPATITLKFAMGGKLTVTTGQTLTILGDIVAGPYRIFDNVLSGQGTLSFAGNRIIQKYQAAWWGVVGDNSTNCNAMLQSITDQFSDDDLGLDLILPPGSIVLSGALVEQAGSYFQWVLPTRGPALEHYALTLEGSGPVQLLGYGNQTQSGTILKSTLTTGSGAVMGCRAVGGFDGGCSNLNLHLKDLYVQCAANPTISGLDLRYVKRPYLTNVKVSTGANVYPTEPTHIDSYGIKTSLAWIPADCRLENVVVHGFYNGIEWNELCYATAFTALLNKRAVVVRQSAHVSDSGSHLNLIDNAQQIVFIEGPSYVNFATVNAEDADTGGNWYSTTDDIVDSNNYGHGYIGYHLIVWAGVVSNTLRVTGGKHLDIWTIGDRTRPANHIEAFNAQRVGNPAVSQIYSREPATPGVLTRYAALLMGADNAGTSSTTDMISMQAHFNMAIAGTDKRIAQQTVFTDGQIDSAQINWGIWNAGVGAVQMRLDKYGNLISFSRFAQAEGATLTVSSNTITPTHCIHHVGAGLIKTITVPAGFVSGSISLIADATPYTCDATANIAKAVTGLTAGQVVVFTYTPSDSKWHPSV